MRLPSAFACIAFTLFVLSTARATTVDEYTGGTVTGMLGFYGESFITGNTSAKTITISLLTTGGANYATGNGYLLSQPYAGAPAGLSGATPGFVQAVASSNNAYTFSVGLTLDPNMTYYFYQTLSAVPAGTELSGGSYAGHQSYYSASSGSAFTTQANPLNFRVSGTVPEPATNALVVGSGLLVAFATARRQRNATVLRSYQTME